MCRRRPNVPVRGPLDPVLVHYFDSGDGINRVTYIVSLHGRLPEGYKLWILNEHGVREVHMFARIRILDNFRAGTFQTTFLQFAKMPYSFHQSKIAERQCQVYRVRRCHFGH